MDRSFLSRSEVIAASRRFVCVRLTTYEDRVEGEFLKSFAVTRSGELENSVFAILASDGKRQLARASRSMRHNFEDAHEMAEAMQRIARAHPGKESASQTPPELPRVPNVRLAVNVAACDNQPLVLLFGKDAETRRQLEERLRPLAWSEPFAGRFVYAAASSVKELARIKGAKPEAGVLIVQPDRFGLAGVVLKQVAADATPQELRKCLHEGAALHQREAGSFPSHVRAGQQKGVFWETVIPVTDPMEQRARARGRERGPRP